MGSTRTGTGPMPSKTARIGSHPIVLPAFVECGTGGAGSSRELSATRAAAAKAARPVDELTTS